MDKNRMAFEQWWVTYYGTSQFDPSSRKEGAWAAWQYLTGQDTLAHRQASASGVANLNVNADVSGAANQSNGAATNQSVTAAEQEAMTRGDGGKP